jgi:phosphodiesterase/alkaline phosphatase D-like protein
MRVIFCSCAKLQSFAPQLVWERIRHERPDVLLLLGDNIYLDRNDHVDPRELSEELRRLYAAQFAEENFARLLADLRERHGRVLAIYDDHDFIGDERLGGEDESSLASAARAEFVRAFQPVQTGDDVYHATQVGDVLFVVCDTRFYRRSPSVSATDRNAVLGEAQWTWLEQTLASASAPFIVIAASTNFHRFRDEAWEQYPVAFTRLRQLLLGRAGALIVSGDIHNNDSYDESGVIELVSSGVSRQGLVFGGLRENYGILDFDSLGVSVEFKGLKPRQRSRFRIDLASWQL